MKTEAQQIAIAEACGWTKVFPDNGMCHYEWIWVSPQGVQAEEYNRNTHLPSYLTDLNAMHEAEKVLKREQLKRYHDILADVAGFSYCEADTHEETELDWDCRICHATAAHRAEALLKTLGLWNENK